MSKECDSIVVSGLRLDYEQPDEAAIDQARQQCGLGRSDLLGARIYKKSLDLRHGKLTKVFSVLLETPFAQQVVNRCQQPSIRMKPQALSPQPSGCQRLEHPPVVVGFGPAGLFAALILAENGYQPLVLEQGEPLERRDAAIAHFNATGQLDECSNIQFGEGGAGAYSDGKLTTRINDPRCELVLERLLEHGAPAEVGQAAKPHIGTDALKGVVVAMRQRILALGGRVEFATPVQALGIAQGSLRYLETPRGQVPCQVAVLAVGHSARPLFETLVAQQIELEPKAFSVGVRAEHLQQDIDRGRYGEYAQRYALPPAEYNLSLRRGERACYSFCMCPGGHVVAAASQQGGVVTNGMSYHARSGPNANAALAVSVLPSDFSQGPLGGVAFQRQLEQAAFAAGGGDFAAPVQLLGDLRENRASTGFGRVRPSYPRGTNFNNLTGLLPPFVTQLLLEAMPVFGRQLPGFDGPDTLLTGVETRTSSPVRIRRGEDLYATRCQGLIPCGEGAGYAGGIMSAAVDGIRAAQKILEEYAPLAR